MGVGRGGVGGRWTRARCGSTSPTPSARSIPDPAHSGPARPTRSEQASRPMCRTTARCGTGGRPGPPAMRRSSGSAQRDAPPWPSHAVRMRRPDTPLPGPARPGSPPSIRIPLFRHHDALAPPAGAPYPSKMRPPARPLSGAYGGPDGMPCLLTADRPTLQGLTAEDLTSMSI